MDEDWPESAADGSRHYDAEVHGLLKQLLGERIRMRRALTKIEQLAAELSRSLDVQTLADSLRASVLALRNRAAVHRRLEAQWLLRGTGDPAAQHERSKRVRSEHEGQQRILDVYTAALGTQSRDVALLALLGSQLAATFRKDLDTFEDLLSAL